MKINILPNIVFTTVFILVALSLGFFLTKEKIPLKELKKTLFGAVLGGGMFFFFLYFF